MNAQRNVKQHHATFEGARKEFSRAMPNHFGDVTGMVWMGDAQ